MNKIVINAQNISGGGGLSHLKNLLTAFDEFSNLDFEVELWASKIIRKKLPEFKWLLKSNYFLFRIGFIGYLINHVLLLIFKSKIYSNAIYFIPGGWTIIVTKNTAAMSQNILPYEPLEIMRFPLLMRIKFHLIRYLQIRTFKKSKKIIYLSRYASSKISNYINIKNKNTVIIPHGVDEGFYYIRKPEDYRDDFSQFTPCKLVYVSSIDLYKNHIEVVEAISKLLKCGLHLHLKIIGPELRGGNDLRKHIARLQNLEWVIEFTGNLSPLNLMQELKESDIGIFASSCENLPISLLEMMASSLPICCSNLGVMPEVLGDSGIYFDPRNSDEIANKIDILYKSVEIRNKLGDLAFKKSQTFTWNNSARKTLKSLGANL